MLLPNISSSKGLFPTTISLLFAEVCDLSGSAWSVPPFSVF